jgi:hypothetical protein
MALPPGTRLGPYEIAAPLGAGGMGEVYRARDTRLGRDVAIKVLSARLSASPEVRAISQLNHPHICTLHDVGHQEGIDYLVMELLEGETLAHRLEKGPLLATVVVRRPPPRNPYWGKPRAALRDRRSRRPLERNGALLGRRYDWECPPKSET